MNVQIKQSSRFCTGVIIAICVVMMWVEPQHAAEWVIAQGVWWLLLRVEQALS
jgi:hypothetical protein